MTFKSRMPILRSLVKNRLLQVLLFVLILAGVAALSARVAPPKAQEQQPINGRRHSVLVEKGFVLPSQLLAGVEKGIANSDRSNRPIFTESIKLPEQFTSGAPFDVTFTIAGNARFDNPQGAIAITSAKNGVIKTPPIVAGPSFGESFINVVVNGQTVIENLRVVTLETGDIENIKKRIEADEPGILVLGDRYAIIDESQLRETYQTISVQIEAPSDRDVKIIEDPKAPIATTAIGGVCAREFWGPGRVNWYGYTSFFNPWTSEEWGYKPESIDWVAYRADDLASDNIDGLYKRTWGCGIVLKVPDNCTIDISRGSSTYSACCNAFAWYVLGHRIEWVSPGAIKGPNCLN